MKRSLSLSAMMTMGAIACGSGGDPAPSAPVPVAPAAVPEPPLAAQIAIDDIAVYQGVRVTLVKEGVLAPADRMNAPVIALRPAVIRVFVKAIGRTRPTVDGELHLQRPGKPDLVLRDAGKSVGTVLDDEVLASTLNFEVAAEEITPETTFSVRVGPKLAAGLEESIAYPADGSALPLAARTGSQTLRVKFVPITMDDAGTSRVPDLADVSFYKQALYKMYPVASVDISVREPFAWTQAVEPDGDGWNELLNGIMQLRRADKSPQNVYYVGVFTPKESMDEFCNRGGCVLGIAPQASEREVNLRIALVLGYQSRGAGGTLAQELAHAMGRWHAPCGNPKAIDTDFPYRTGSIGTWGYDVLDKKWISPDRYRDFMSYCGPVWASDYTYRGIYERMEIVSKQAAALEQQPTKAMQSFRVGKDGVLHEGPEVDVLDGGPDEATELGESAAVRYERADGTVALAANGRVRRISGTDGRIILAPLAPAGAMRARVTGMGVTELRAARLRGAEPTSR